jgi:hypothetical protein
MLRFAQAGSEERHAMTAQIHELLLLDGEWTSMAFVPPLPADHPRIGVASEEKRRAAPSIITSSTACWRRYRGTWEVRDGRFSLLAIEGHFELTGDGPLPADWFSGVLRVPRGEVLTYIHMGFASVFEEEEHITVEGGRVTGRRVIDNRGRKVDKGDLGLRNLPGGENRFPGDGKP